MASRKLEVVISGDSRSLDRALRNAARSADGFGSRMRRVGGVVAKAAGVMGVAVGAGLAVALKRGFDELAEGQKVSAQTAAALKSTGGVANVTAKQIADLAGSLSQLTGIDDEQIQANENLLLTFKNVRNELGKGNAIFDRATKASLDLSTAGFGSLESASKMLGKALNDPVKGMTAMGRAGVTFSEDQKKAIKALVESGKTLEAQKLILKEVESQVGGSAEAYGKTLPGQLAKARNAFDEIAGKVALKFLPALTSALAWVNANWATIEAVLSAVSTAVLAAFQAMASAADWLSVQWQRHQATVRAAWASVQQAVAQTIAWFRANVLPAVQNIIAAVMAVWDRFGGDITRILRTAFGMAIVVVRTLLLNLKNAIEIITALIRGDWGKAWEALKAIVSRTLGAMVTLIRGSATIALTAAKAVGGAILDGIAAGLVGIALKVSDGMQRVWDTLKTAAANAYRLAAKIGGEIISGIWDGVKDKLSWLKEKIGNAIGRILSSFDIPGFSPPESAGAKAIGRPISDGILRGFLEGTAELPAKMSDRLRTAIEKAKQAVENQRAAVQAAWGRLADDAMRAFDARTQQGLDRIQAKLDAKLGRIDAQLSRKLGGIEKNRAAETPAEKALREAEEGIAAQDRQERLADAQRQLAEAQAGGDPDAILQAQRALRDAEREIALAALRQQAEDERAARDAAAAAAAAAAEKQAANQRKRAQAAADREQLEYQAKRDRTRRNLEDWLTVQESILEQHPKQWEAIHRKVMKRFRDSFGPDFQTAGKNLGKAFAEGLTASMAAMESAAEQLAKLIAKYLRTASPTEKGPLSTLDTWWDGFVPALMSGLDTRSLTSFMGSLGPPQMAGSLALASGGGGGGFGGGATHITVNVNGTVLGADKRRLAEEIALEIDSALARHKRGGGSLASTG